MKQGLQGKFLILTFGLLTFVLTSCGEGVMETEADSYAGMGRGGGMMAFHMATIPDEYVSLSSPIADDENSIERGEQVFTANCATCHGDGGMGDGPAGIALTPAPAPIAHTSQMMSDAYLYWRISEGGVDFQTSMLPFKAILTEEQRWDVINYVRALGAGDVMPMGQFGGQMNDPAIQATQQTEMLSTAVAQGVISEGEAEFFATFHDLVDGYIAENRTELSSAGGTMMETGLDAMVEASKLTRDQADQFVDIHNRLLEAGLMN